MIDYEHSLKLWQSRRSEARKNAHFYKEGMLEKAAQRYKKGDKELMKIAESIEQSFGYIVDEEPHRLHRMIEDNAPGPCHMNLSPEHDYAVPHGLWEWDPKEPDVIVDSVTKTRFPNDDYPEDGELITTWGKKKQTFRFYTGKSIEYNRFTIYASFSGKVRYFKVQHMIEAAYQLAFYFRLTGCDAYGKKAVQILMRFADVYPHWHAHGMYGDIADMDPHVVGRDPLHLPAERTALAPNPLKKELHVGYWGLGRATASGQEGGGFMLPMSITYSMVADATDQDGDPLMSEEQKLRFEKDVLLESATLVVFDESINNKSCSNRFGAMAVGMLTGVEPYVEYGKEGFLQIVQDWYLKDGSTSESPSYSMMVMSSMWIGAEWLDGYKKEDESKPFDIFGRDEYRAVWKGMYDTLLQNGEYPASADARQHSAPTELFVKIMAYRFKRPEYIALLSKKNGEPAEQKKKVTYHVLPDGEDTPCAGEPVWRDIFFPDFRQGYLRIGKNNGAGTIILYATEWGVHHHADSLNLFYYWNGMECLSDLGYLWDQPERHMTLRTAAHNLVIVDEKEQIRQGRNGFLHDFSIMDGVKSMDCSSMAYEKADAYRRAVTLVEMDGDTHYVVDCFHVDAASTKDYIMHGPSDAYSIFHATSEPFEDSCPYLLQKPKQLNTTDQSKIVWQGEADQRFSMYMPYRAEQTVVLARGWGQRGTTDTKAVLPYLMLRVQKPDWYTFVNVFAASKGDCSIDRVTVCRTPDQKMVAVCVVREDQTHDLIVRRFDTDSVTCDTEAGRLRFDGTYAVIRDVYGISHVFMVGGKVLTLGERRWSMPDEKLQGDILSFDKNGFTVRAPVDKLRDRIGQTVIVSDRKKKTGYPILDVQPVDDGVYMTVWSQQGDGFRCMGGESWSIEPQAQFGP